MYTIKVQCFDSWETGQDVAQPIQVETVGHMETADAAEAFAEMVARHDGVAAVWVEAHSFYN